MVFWAYLSLKNAENLDVFILMLSLVEHEFFITSGPDI